VHRRQVAAIGEQRRAARQDEGDLRLDDPAARGTADPRDTERQQRRDECDLEPVDARS
jgi:hypothetical protein